MINNLQHLKIYEEIQENISEALTSLEGVQIKNKKGNAYVDDLKNQLNGIRFQFSEEVTFLEDNSEWEKFTIAFFGETNAGKSTILESLRIIFNENERQMRIKKLKATAEDYEKKFSDNFNNLTKDLKNYASEYLNKTRYINNQIKELTKIIIQPISLPKKIITYTLFVTCGFFVGCFISIMFPDFLNEIRDYLTAIIGMVK